MASSITKRNNNWKEQSCHHSLIKLVNYTAQILDILSEANIKNCHLLLNLSGGYIRLHYMIFCTLGLGSFFFLDADFDLFIYFWLCWVFVSVRGLSLVVARGGHSSSWCAGLSLSQPLLLRSTGSRRAGSVVVAHRPSWSAACGIFPDQGSNPCPLH